MFIMLMCIIMDNPLIILSESCSFNGSISDYFSYANVIYYAQLCTNILSPTFVISSTSRINLF